MRGAFCSVHTHSTMCDGKNTLEEMAQAAFQAGCVSFGASGHSHTPLPEDAGEVLPADMTAYRAEVLRLREEYAGRMDVLLGIELDNVADVTAEGFDYWIGSAHHMRDPEGGWHAVDWSREALERSFRESFKGDSLLMTERYYDEVRRVAERGPTILGHIDLIAKFNGDGYFFDEEAPGCRAAALAALHAADPKETLLEINTGAMSRGYRTAPYPAPGLLRAARERHIPICITSDCHSRANLLHAFPQAAELAKAAGYRERMILTKQGFVPVGLEDF